MEERPATGVDGVGVTLGARYWHFKGGVYLVLAIAETHEHNGDLDVVYLSLKHGKIVTRPLHASDSRGRGVAWLEPVRWPDGVTRARFVQGELLSQLEHDGLQKIWNDVSGMRGLANALARVLAHVGVLRPEDEKRLDVPELVDAAEAFIKRP